MSSGADESTGAGAPTPGVAGSVFREVKPLRHEAANVGSCYRDGYNWQVLLAPTDRWQWAVWAAARSTRFVGSAAPPEARGPAAHGAWFAEIYERRAHAPLLWYTRGGSLGEEIYEFLFRLPGLGTVVVLEDGEDDRALSLRDANNLRAMLAESWSPRIARSGSERPAPNVVPSELNGEHGEDVQRPAARAPGDGAAPKNNATPAVSAGAGRLSLTGGPSTWFELHRRVSELMPTQLFTMPRVALVGPASAHFACALAPLAAYIQATFVLAPAGKGAEPDVVASLVNEALRPDSPQEIWLAGPLVRLERDLTRELAAATGLDRVITIRTVPGEDHFALSHHAALLLTVYRYMDWLLCRTISGGPAWENRLFDFLRRDEMLSLSYQTTRVMGLARQLQDRNYRALSQIHAQYWSMSWDERRAFVSLFRDAFKQEEIVTRGLAVVADYAADEDVPHNLIDAAAFAARRAAPLLLFRPMTQETSGYVGALTDKIENHLGLVSDLRRQRLVHVDALTRFLDEPVEEGAAPDPGGPGSQQREARWVDIEARLDDVHRALGEAQDMLRNAIYKTGEVLHESLVPLAVHNTLTDLQPRYLAVFVQDPSVPIELLREPPVAGKGPDTSRAAALGTADLSQFWSLRYAIGHVSSVNLYETNLTSNIASFAREAASRGHDRVLLCANPTGDLHFTEEEASGIARLFEGDDSRAVSGRPRWRVVHMRSLSGHQGSSPAEGDLAPTRANLIRQLHEGARLVHYSGHAFFDNVLPGRSGLMLRDGVLTASDIRFTLKLGSSPLIYASACAAGRIKSVSSRFTGLAAAFIRAGAAGYVSSLWSIDDAEAAKLAVLYYRVLLGASPGDAEEEEPATADFMPVGESLLLAKRRYAEAGSIAWASLVLYGDPTRSLTGDPGTARKQAPTNDSQQGIGEAPEDTHGTTETPTVVR